MTTNSKVAKKCDELIIIDNGQILCHKSTIEILDDPYFSKYFKDLNSKTCEESGLNDLKVSKTIPTADVENFMLIQTLSEIPTIGNDSEFNKVFQTNDSIVKGYFEIKENVIFKKSLDIYIHKRIALL